MKKIVIIGANDFQNQLILKAKSLGYETHVFAWECGDAGEKTADCFYPISIVEKDKILDECLKIKPCGICSIASDLAAITVNYVAEKLNLPHNSQKCTEISTNKFRMRQAFAEHHIPTPKFAVCGSNTIPNIITDFTFPCIVKPTDRSGSRAITKIEDILEIQSALNNAIEQSFEKKAIIEEFIEGDEYSCECISQNGKHHFLAVTKKFTTGAPFFIETGHMEPSGLSDETIERIKPQVFNALDALEITNSASHTEFKMDKNGNIHIIEIGARMGGDCIGSDLVYLSTGYDFMKMVIDVACGNCIDLSLSEHYRKAEIHFILTAEDYSNLIKIQEKNSDEIYRISHIDSCLFGKTSDSSTRAGYYILAY